MIEGLAATYFGPSCGTRREYFLFSPQLILNIYKFLIVLNSTDNFSLSIFVKCVVIFGRAREQEKIKISSNNNKDNLKEHELEEMHMTITHD